MDMQPKVSGFDWDEGNVTKCQKHGVPLKAIESAFKHSPWVFPDVKHSDQEARFIAVGKSVRRHILVVFTFRKINKQTYIRPVSARYMHKKEIEYYKRFI